MERESSGIWVYSQYRNNTISRASLELIGKARQLADGIEAQVCAVLLGYEIELLARELIAHGADRVYLAEHPSLRNYATIPYTNVLADLVLKEDPAIILFPANENGRDLAPRIAARLETGLTADCTDLEIGSYEDKLTGRKYENILYQIRPAFGGDVMAMIVNPERRPQMATVRVGAFDPPPRDPARTGQVVKWDVNLDSSDCLTGILETLDEEKPSALQDAKVIVGVGAGIGGARGLDLVTRLADLLGAEIGASRRVVDAGWTSHSHQVGLSGKTVRPDIYLACGISGAIQHLVGVKNSKKIIAINKDPKAPIFQMADYCIVGDLFEVVPKLVEKLSDLNKNSHDHLVRNTPKPYQGE